jgi:hypothetical protein
MRCRPLATTGLFDDRPRTLFSADSLGAVQPEVAEHLLCELALAARTPPVVGPDQAALEASMQQAWLAQAA